MELVIRPDEKGKKHCYCVQKGKKDIDIQKMDIRSLVLACMLNLKVDFEKYVSEEQKITSKAKLAQALTVIEISNNKDMIRKNKKVIFRLGGKPFYKSAKLEAKQKGEGFMEHVMQCLTRTNNPDAPLQPYQLSQFNPKDPVSEPVANSPQPFAIQQPKATQPKELN